MDSTTSEENGVRGFLITENNLSDYSAAGKLTGVSMLKIGLTDDEIKAIEKKYKKEMGKLRFNDIESFRIN